MIPEDLQQYIETEIIPRYNNFDRGHNISHARTVIEESLTLAANYPDVNLSMAYTIAAYHDTGMCKDRKTHHLVSGEILVADKNLRKWFSEEEILIMKEAVEDHRASSNREPRSVYGKIVAEADRLINEDTVFRRAVQYGLKQNPSADIEWHYKRFNDHMEEKYAPGGYLKLWIPGSGNDTKLKELQSIIANKPELRKRFEKIFAEEN